MKTDEIISELRKKAKVFQGEPMWLLLKDAADRLEELDERVAIMEEGRGDMDITSSVVCGDTFPSEGKAFGKVDDYDEHKFSGLIDEE